MEEVAGMGSGFTDGIGSSSWYRGGEFQDLYSKYYQEMMGGGFPLPVAS
jgi:hypothetical protein